MIEFPAKMLDRFVRNVAERNPIKSFGYFVSMGDPYQPCDFFIMQGNVRNDAEWQASFHEYGQYFVDHDDAGFVVTPEEALEVQRKIAAAKQVEVGVFHSHQRHPANFSLIDFDMHVNLFDDLWHVILSLRDPQRPVLRAFDVRPEGVRLLPVSGAGVLQVPERQRLGSDEIIRRLRTDLAGCMRPESSMVIVESLMGLSADQREVILREAFPTRSARFENYAADHMVTIPASTFEMGTSAAANVSGRRMVHFLGETPARRTSLDAFMIGKTPVTNELYSLADPVYRERDPLCPAVNISWYSAVLFSAWMGCRLPSEAEWEFACAGGAASEWYCEREEELIDYAWYGENAAGELRHVAQKKPNGFGLFDMHGNIWEWCEDAYHDDAYTRSQDARAAQERPGIERVARGGGIYALATMCRTRYRLPEPPDVRARDQGIRLAATP